MSEEAIKNLYIGTSGIVLPGPKKSFPQEYQAASRLHYYASLFNSLEVNSSFYKVPLPETFAKWEADVPRNFQFTVKIWRDITHARGLNADQEKIDYFMKALSLMSRKKGCLLVQFPASVTFDSIEKVTQILDRLHRLDPQGTWRKAVEFRHPDWYNETTYSLLDSYHASIVLHDMPQSRTRTLNQATDFVYIRFHGTDGDYKGSYSEEFLQDYAHDIRAWLAQGKHVYAYFNNTIGDAFANAQTLKYYMEQ